MARKIDGRGETATRDQKVVATIFENLDTSNAVTVNEGDVIAILVDGDSSDTDVVVGVWVQAHATAAPYKAVGLAGETKTFAAGATGSLLVVYEGFARRAHLETSPSTAVTAGVMLGPSESTAGRLGNWADLTAATNKRLAVALTADASILKDDDGYAHFDDVETLADYCSVVVLNQGFFK